MSNKSDDNNDTSHHDENASDTAAADSIEIDERETEAGFLDDLPPDERPAVLRLTSQSFEAHKEDAIERAERWEAGEEVPRVVNFQNPSDLRALLTDRRVELLRSLMAEPADSIRQLAERVDRDVKSIHDDLGVLADYEIVQFKPDGRAKQPFVPYERIEMSLEISTPQPGDDTATA